MRASDCHDGILIHVNVSQPRPKNTKDHVVYPATISALNYDAGLIVCLFFVTSFLIQRLWLRKETLSHIDEALMICE